MCGEKCKRNRETGSRRGSPPHVRGKATVDGPFATASRITPACAGKRFEKDPTEKGYKDHPRMCGEKLYTPCMIAPKVGSPPHVRGKEISDIETAKKMGITPACAGKSALLNALIAVPSGSPPHVRGKEVDTVAKTAVAGITPACAGKRVRGICLPALRWDHPRMCGEKTKKIP